MPSTQHIGPGRQAVRDILARRQAAHPQPGAQAPAGAQTPVELAESARPIEPQEDPR